MNEAKSILTFLQITWKSMCIAEPSDLEISTCNSRKQVTMPKGSNFTKFFKGYKNVILEYFLILKEEYKLPF